MDRGEFILYLKVDLHNFLLDILPRIFNLKKKLLDNFLIIIIFVTITSQSGFYRKRIIK